MYRSLKILFAIALALLPHRGYVSRAVPGPVGGADLSRDAPLEGRAALDLYLAELGCNVVAITEQSTLLLRALTERAALLLELQRVAAPATDDGPSEKT